MKILIMRPRKIFLVLLFSISIIACKQNKWPCLHAKGNIITNTVDKRDFKKINFETEGTVYLKQDSVYSITITASENIIDKIVFEENEDALNIYSKRCLGDKSDVIITITAPDINSLSSSGTGSINTIDSFLTETMELQISGSGSINANTVTVTTNAKISGSGSIILSGSANNYDVNISGSGSVHSFNFPTQYCSVDISGSGNTEINAAQSLTISISGSGDVYYKGKPTLSIDVSGSGSIIDSN